jgi:hypothetical protein
MKRNIRNFLGTSGVSVALLLAASIPGLAKNSRGVALSHDVVLGGTTLSAGSYVVEWETHSPEATVQFMQHHNVVLSTQGRIEQRDHAYEDNAIVYDTGSHGTLSLIEIRFAGSKEVLVFNQ